MSWSKTSSGAPAEIAEVIANAIRNSVDYQPPSAARQRTGELVATSSKKIILAAASDDVRTINESGNIAVESWGHINDDGSLESNKLSIAVLPVVRQFHAEPAKTAPGPDAVTHEEVDAAISGAGVAQLLGRPEPTIPQPDNANTEAGTSATGESEKSPLADDAGI